MTNRNDVLERLRSANPLPDLDSIDPAELTDLRPMVDERRIAADLPPAAAAPSGAPKMRPAWAVALAAAVLLVLIGAGAWLLTLRGSDDASTEVTGPDDAALTEPQPETPTQPPAEEPTQRPAAEPEVRSGSLPEWTTFTAATGLPGDDVITLDTNPDGTIWATVALDRQTVDYGYRVDEDVPGRMGFAVFDGAAWTTVEPPTEIVGYVRLAAGPNGTAWLVGGMWQDGGGAVTDMPLGTQGLWYFDGTEWITYFEGRPGEGELRPVGAEVGPDGVLWSSGYPTDGPGPVLLSFDGDSWTTVDPPEFASYYAGMVDIAFTNYVDEDNEVWVFVDDNWSPEQVSIRLARLDGDTWTEFPTVLDTPVAPEVMGTAHRYAVLEANGGSFVYFYWSIPPFEPDPFDDVEPAQVGDPLPYLIAEFDGTAWGEPVYGELLITEGHNLDQEFPMQAIAASSDHLYLSDLGGLTELDRTTGGTTTLTVDDGLASAAVRDLVVAPDGSVWVATDAGISRYVPTTTG